MTDAMSGVGSGEGLDDVPPGDPADQPQPLAERGANRSQRPTSEAFKQFIAEGWQPRVDALPDPLPAASFTAQRRAALSARFPGERLVIAAGGLKVRSNDTDYRFRAHSAFTHLTGLGSQAEPDSVLVLHPEPRWGDDAEQGEDGDTAGHRAVLYVWPRAGRDSEEFYANARYGELWVGPRPTLAEVEALTGLECSHLSNLEGDLRKGAEHLVLRDNLADPQVGEWVLSLRENTERTEPAPADPTQEQLGLDEEFCQFLSELRLIKDDFELAELRSAVAATIDGFADVVQSLETATGHDRGERIVETTFEAAARLAGNGVGYDTIAAAGEHATTLHWIDNDGPVRPGELILLDAGIEVDSLYTADITRTLPIEGRFSDPQRQVYEAVLEAADAAFAVVRPGVTFHAVHDAAMRVIATKLHEWGLLPVSVEESLDKETGGQHRRWMVHGTSHHLGLDVHDCAQARREMYLDAELRPGMVFTIEPGLYFQPDDLLVPAELRGIGVRIEDDVLVTETGYENLSAALPRASADVEEWMQALRTPRGTWA